MDSVRKVNGHLSKRIQTIWPWAMVVSEPIIGGEEFHVMKNNEKWLGLGRHLGEATQAIDALIHAERTSTKGESNATTRQNP